MKSIYGITRSKLEEYFVNKGDIKFRATQIFEWVYRKRAKSFDEMSNIKKETIELLKQDFYFNNIKIVTKEEDELVKKYLFELSDGNKIEAVLMEHDYGKSICVSSQIGCNMGCAFCESGRLKKVRNLTSDEMLLQVLKVEEDIKDRISHVVIMGIGEPFDNYDNVMDFCKIINHDKGLAIGARKITISTCGLVNRIYDFSNEQVQYNLAISLHASNDELRSKLMPINKAYPLDELFKALRYYSKKNNRRLTFEYILLKGVNDSYENAVEISKLLKGMNAFVNLIPYNEVDEHGFKTTDDKTALKFYDWLMKNNVKATLRTKHGDDIDAACGQLRAKHEGV